MQGVPWEPEPGRSNIELNIKVRMPREEEPVIENIKEKTPEVELPENIDKLVKFMNETGGTIEDYVKLNTDYSKLDDSDLLRSYYQQTKGHLTGEEIEFLIEVSITE